MREGVTQTIPLQPDVLESRLSLEEDVERLERTIREFEAGLQVHSRILSNFLHDLRTPIVAIRGYVKMLLECRVGPLNEKQQNYLATVAQNAVRLIELANDMDFLRIASPAPFSEIRLDELVRGCTRQLDGTFPTVRITEIISDRPVWIVGDEGRLQTALFSFLCHAVRLGKPEDELIVELARNHDLAVLRISNRGTAIPPRLLEDLFSAQSNFPGKGGSEIELRQARRVLWLHGCRIHVASVPEDSFSFTLEFATAGSVGPVARGDSAKARL